MTQPEQRPRYGPEEGIMSAYSEKYGPMPTPSLDDALFDPSFREFLSSEGFRFVPLILSECEREKIAFLFTQCVSLKCPLSRCQRKILTQGFAQAEECAESDFDSGRSNARGPICHPFSQFCRVSQTRKASETRAKKALLGLSLCTLDEHYSML